MKTCYRCKRDLPLSSFSKNKNYADGLQRDCRQCRSDYMQANYKQNRADWGRANKASKTASRKKYDDNNRDKKKARNLAIKKVPLKSKCSYCGKPAKARHHWAGYQDNPLAVVSVCARCHGKAESQTSLGKLEGNRYHKQIDLALKAKRYAEGKDWCVSEVPGVDLAKLDLIVDGLFEAE